MTQPDEPYEFATVDELTADMVSDVTEVVIIGPGKAVRVRGVTRFELLLNGKGTDDTAVIEQRMVSKCILEPKMTAAQVERWQKGSNPDGLKRVTEAIQRLSGMGKAAGKSDVAEVRD